MFAVETNKQGRHQLLVTQYIQIYTYLLTGHNKTNWIQCKLFYLINYFVIIITIINDNWALLHHSFFFFFFYKISGLLTHNLTLNYIQDVAPPSLLEVVSWLDAFTWRTNDDTASIKQRERPYFFLSTLHCSAEETCSMVCEVQHSFIYFFVCVFRD